MIGRYIDEAHIDIVNKVSGVPNIESNPKVMQKLHLHFIIDDTEDMEGYSKIWSAYALNDGAIHVIESDYVPIEPAPITISKGDFIEALVKTDLYDEVKAIYASDLDMQIAFAGFAYIDLNNAVVQSFIAKYPDVFTEENIQRILNA